MNKRNKEAADMVYRFIDKDKTLFTLYQIYFCAYTKIHPVYVSSTYGVYKITPNFGILLPPPYINVEAEVP